MHPRIARTPRLATTFVFTALAAVACMAQGCGPDKPADGPTGTTGGPSTAPSAMPSAMPSAPTTATTAPADAAAKARIEAAKATPLAAPVANPGKDDMFERALVDTAAWFASGLTADGPYFKATLAEKGQAHADITLKAGKCYVLVGYAKLGTIIDLDLTLLKASGEKVAEDDDDDATPTIGKPQLCPATDTPYLVELKADKGAGDGVMQLFSKAK